MPGEQAWPTQPFPTRIPPLEDLGATEADAIDFTPDLHAAAVAEMKKLRLGPDLHAAVGARHAAASGHHRRRELGRRPRSIAVSGRLFVKTSNQAHVARLGKPEARAGGSRSGLHEAGRYVARSSTTACRCLKGPVRPPDGHRSQSRRRSPGRCRSATCRRCASILRSRTSSCRIAWRARCAGRHRHRRRTGFRWRRRWRAARGQHRHGRRRLGRARCRGVRPGRR